MDGCHILPGPADVNSTGQIRNLRQAAYTVHIKVIFKGALSSNIIVFFALYHVIMLSSDQNIPGVLL